MKRKKKVTRAAAPSDKPLSLREQQFADQFIITGVGRQAAILAGYAEGSAEVTACRLLKRPHILSYIECEKARVFDKLAITKERVMKEYARLAFSDIREYFNPDGSLKPITELSDDAAAALSSVETDELFEGFGESRKQIGVTRKIKLNGKREALNDIRDTMGWRGASGDDDLTINVVIKKGGTDAGIKR